MQKKQTYKAVGLFVIIGLLCFSAIVLRYLGKTYWNNANNLVVMFFREPLQGLSVGSSVVLQGVQIGQVEKISLLANLSEGTFQTAVYARFDAQKMYSYSGQHRNHVSNRKLLSYLIRKGLRARLVSANYLTGQLIIELIMDPSQPVVLSGSGKYMEIPTVLSAFAKISEDLKNIPLHEGLMRLGDILVDLDDNLPTILQNTAQITGNLDKMLSSKASTLSDTIANINMTLEEITEASRSIKNLMDYLERHPEAIIQGKEQ